MTESPKHFRALNAAIAVLMAASVVSAEEAKPRNGQDVMAEIRAAEGSPQEIETLIGLLKNELEKPSVPYFGLVGGPIDSDYICSVIVGKLANPRGLRGEKGRGQLLFRKTQSMRGKSTGIYSYLVVAAALADPGEARPEVLTILEAHPSPGLRQNAAMAVAQMNEKEAVPALTKALRDSGSVRVRLEGNSLVVYSHVREAAANGLRRKGINVPEDAAILSQSSALPLLKAMLYRGGSTARSALSFIQWLGKEERIQILREFVSDASVPHSVPDGVLQEARRMLLEMRSDGETAPGQE